MLALSVFSFDLSFLIKMCSSYMQDHCPYGLVFHHHFSVRVTNGQILHECPSEIFYYNFNLHQGLFLIRSLAYNLCFNDVVIICSCKYTEKKIHTSVPGNWVVQWGVVSIYSGKTGPKPIRFMHPKISLVLSVPHWCVIFFFR